MTITLTQLYEALSVKLGKSEAETLTTYVEDKISSEYIKNKSAIVAEFHTEFEKLRTELKTENMETRVEVAKSKNNLLWAMIVLLLPLYATITFALITLLRK